MNQRGGASLHLILTIFLGIGMVLFGVLAVVAYSDNENMRTTLNQRLIQAKTDAAAEQKKQDDEANRKANDLPYRTYTADAVDGGFSLQIPKSWSLYAGKNASQQLQLDLAANPSVVVKNLGSSAINTHAFKLQLFKRSTTDIVKTYDERIKKKKLTSKGIQVSGIAANQFDGEIDDQRHTGTVIVLQVRDKTMVLSNENPTYRDEFNKIVSSAKINP